MLSNWNASAQSSVSMPVNNNNKNTRLQWWCFRRIFDTFSSLEKNASFIFKKQESLILHVHVHLAIAADSHSHLCARLHCYNPLQGSGNKRFVAHTVKKKHLFFTTSHTWHIWWNILSIVSTESIKTSWTSLFPVVDFCNAFSIWSSDPSCRRQKPKRLQKTSNLVMERRSLFTAFVLLTTMSVAVGTGRNHG